MNDPLTAALARLQQARVLYYTQVVESLTTSLGEQHPYTQQMHYSLTLARAGGYSGS